MNDEQSFTSKDTTWDSFEDTGPSVYEDAMFQRRFALSAFGDTVTARQDEPNGTESGHLFSDREPAAITNRHIQRVGDSLPDSTPEPSRYDETRSEGEEGDRQPTVGAVCKPAGVTPESPLESTPGPRASEEMAPSRYDERSEVETGPKSYETKTTIVTAVPDDTVQDRVCREEPGLEPFATRQIIDPLELTKAATLLAIAADEYMKEQADIEYRKEPRPIALVQAQTFVEAVQAAFTAPAPGDDPSGAYIHRRAQQQDGIDHDPRPPLLPDQLRLNDVESEWFDA